jgi:hypothetical protein
VKEKDTQEIDLLELVTHRESKERLFFKDILSRVKKYFHLDIILAQRRRKHQQTDLVERIDIGGRVASGPAANRVVQIRSSAIHNRQESRAHTYTPHRCRRMCTYAPHKCSGACTYASNQ